MYIQITTSVFGRMKRIWLDFFELESTLMLAPNRFLFPTYRINITGWLVYSFHFSFFLSSIAEQFCGVALARAPLRAHHMFSDRIAGISQGFSWEDYNTVHNYTLSEQSRLMLAIIWSDWKRDSVWLINVILSSCWIHQRFLPFNGRLKSISYTIDNLEIAL